MTWSRQQRNKAKVARLVENRRQRMTEDGPRFDLTDEEIARSSATAMRLANRGRCARCLGPIRGQAIWSNNQPLHRQCHGEQQAHTFR